MHANALISAASSSGAYDEAATSTPTIRLPTTSENAATTKPLTTTGSARPRKSGSRGAGVTSR